MFVWGGLGAQDAHHLAGGAVPAGEQVSRPGVRGTQQTRVRRPGGLGRNTSAKLFGGIAAGLIRRI